jgi:hypothetical protein
MSRVAVISIWGDQGMQSIDPAGRMIPPAPGAVRPRWLLTAQIAQLSQSPFRDLFRAMDAPDSDRNVSKKYT